MSSFARSHQSLRFLSSFLAAILLITDPVVFYAADTLVASNDPQATAPITAADAQILLNNQEAQISALNGVMTLAATQAAVTPGYATTFL